MIAWRRCAGLEHGRACGNHVWSSRPGEWDNQAGRFVGSLCKSCWSTALELPPVKLAEVAADPLAPKRVLKKLALSTDPVVLARLAGRELPKDVRARLESNPYRPSHREHTELEPAWRLYRRTPPSHGAVSIAIAALAIVAVAGSGAAAWAMQDGGGEAGELPTTTSSTSAPPASTSTTSTSSTSTSTSSTTTVAPTTLPATTVPPIDACPFGDWSGNDRDATCGTFPPDTPAPSGGDNGGGPAPTEAPSMGGNGPVETRAPEAPVTDPPAPPRTDPPATDPPAPQTQTASASVSCASDGGTLTMTVRTKDGSGASVTISASPGGSNSGAGSASVSVAATAGTYSVTYSGPKNNIKFGWTGDVNCA